MERAKGLGSVESPAEGLKRLPQHIGAAAAGECRASGLRQRLVSQMSKAQEVSPSRRGKSVGGKKPSVSKKENLVVRKIDWDTAGVRITVQSKDRETTALVSKLLQDVFAKFDLLLTTPQDD